MAEHRAGLVKPGGRLYAGAPPFLTAPRGVSCPCGLLHSLLLCRWRLLMSAALLSGLFFVRHARFRVRRQRPEYGEHYGKPSPESG